MIDSSFRNVDISELFSWKKQINRAVKLQPLLSVNTKPSSKEFRLCSIYQRCILTAFSIPARTPYDSKVNTRTRGITELGKRTQGDSASMPSVRDIIINSQVILAYAIKINNGFMRNWYRDVWVS